MAILITGASRGIGRAALLELARRGYDVVGVCKNSSEALNITIEEAKTFGIKAVGVAGVDVGKMESVKSVLMSAINNKNISIDAVINNAGISYVGLIQDMSEEDWENMINTNLSSVFYTTKLFLPKMIEKHRGKIINISSVWGNAGASCEVAYSASKGGINSFTKALAKEVAPSGIQVNAIAFGAIDTEMNNHLDEDEKNALTEEIPMGRMGTVEEAAKLIADVYESPGYLTGQIITMDGGWL